MNVKGFRFSAVEAAIKKPGRLDLALICSDAPAAVAAVYTTNKVKAAPVLLDMERTTSGTCRAVVVNSGNANACTGDRGMEDARETARLVAERIGAPEHEVLVSSTGVIGVPLPMERVRGGIPPLVEGLGSATLDQIAAAIMTTDTFPKLEARTGAAGGVGYTIAGIAKGAGMIMPNMATMLAFIVTDAAVDPQWLDRIFRRANDTSFNAITVDGDMSTNDTAIIMANGAAGTPVLSEGSEGAAEFVALLEEVLLSLAKLIVKDGEGATKFVEVTVKGARSDADAKRAAMAVANSCLVKTAFFGQDANWGRIFAAVGYSGADVAPDRAELFFDDVRMVQGGVFAGGDAEARGTGVLRKKEFTVTVDLHLGDGRATVYTSDLSYDYVKINADYRT
ncbi:bifunctional glutamate N-acetyltransferase/amino-acid acetyltransferase ArgJ [Geobacter anodireducens]|uniref:Arginine biosynthesis bifunctional protein ArgJ n=1 Tax=Geobacter anodireducens TaxID=1340425 RepID=A0ABR9NRE5_9BACT|nr:bifunctional glutamate N-acetyltransferase/amino-acid acetyltransferase ArgJ [Geobacter anodireducens]MBE2886833.1 bifunctional glutamate N-acetyltransferase/amino-acid acetyltransferase ArgJ [Geobacter anodireducens]HMN03993.1 bifunctional glutamate N-acetyltransferase/amino-acid acetyltransferase ArgJ [Geobacter anodireducens]